MAASSTASMLNSIYGHYIFTRDPLLSGVILHNPALYYVELESCSQANKA